MFYFCYWNLKEECFMYQVVIVDNEPFVLEDLKKSIDWEGSNFEIAYADTDP